MTDRVEEIRERVEKATGPWDLYVEGKGGGARIGSLGREIPSDWGLFREPPQMAEDEEHVWIGTPTAFSSADAVFIANAPSDIRFLLSEIQRLRKELEDVQGHLSLHHEELQGAIKRQKELDAVRGVLEASLETIRGPASDHSIYIGAYRDAGGGYEGLQAVATAALRDTASLSNTLEQQVPEPVREEMER